MIPIAIVLSGHVNITVNYKHLSMRFIYEKSVHYRHFQSDFYSN